MLAPLYDLVSTAVYPELSRDMAMGIGGDAGFMKISRASFANMANDCSVSPKIVLLRLDALRGRIVVAAERIVEECAKVWPSPIYGKIVETIKVHCAHIA